MRRAIVIYSLISMWILGWLAGKFGWPTSIFTGIFLLAPAFVGWRTFSPGKTISRREGAYFIAASTLLICMSIFLITLPFQQGLDRRRGFESNLNILRRRLATTDEFKNIEISYTHRKGGRAYVKGSVLNKDAHDRLMEMISWMPLYLESHYHDGVDYPGKPTAKSGDRSSAWNDLNPQPKTNLTEPLPAP